MNINDILMLMNKMVQLLGKYCSFGQAFNPLLSEVGLFGAAHGWGDQKVRPLKNLSHISCNYETWHCCTLPKGDLSDI